MAKHVKIETPPVAPAVKEIASAVLSKNAPFDHTNYKYSDEWKAADLRNPYEIHSIDELVEASKQNKDLQIEARILATDGEKYSHIKLKREEFLECYARRDSKKFRETASTFVSNPNAFNGAPGGILGNDFIPLIGGPFNKQLYYADYIRMHGTAFFAKNHDPFGSATVSMMQDFTIGRSFRIDSENPALKAFAMAFCEANNFYSLMKYAAAEYCTYGEVMFRFLPGHQAVIAYNWPVGMEVPKAMIPRVRLMDPSAIWDITTMPEDISLVVAYNYVAPTQYQIYSGTYQDKKVPSLKFIYEQIPPQEVKHYKNNCVSNEKRGRSDLFPALGYMKRMRDTLDFETARAQKLAAWCLDTEIKGSQADINNYIASQTALGTIPNAGSEFVHTPAIQRKYLGNEHSGGAHTPLFEWNLSMICVATKFPASYYGTVMSTQGTRAGAFVATEPIARRLESRQEDYTSMVRDILVEACKRIGLKATKDDFEVSFPEVITQDRSKKFADMEVAQVNGWISEETLAPIAAKELEIDSFSWEKEKEKIQKDEPTLQQLVQAPLTTPGTAKAPQKTATPGPDSSKSSFNKKIDSGEKAKVKNEHTRLG